MDQAHAVTPLEGEGFSAEVSWIVSGFVSQFGHRHFRQNRYDALLRVRPVDESWKIVGLEILDKERVR